MVKMPVRSGRRYAWVLLSAGGVLFVCSLLFASPDGVPGWKPVNGALDATLEGLAPPLPAADASQQVGTMGAEPAGTSVPSRSVTPPVKTGASVLLDLNAVNEADLDGLPGIGPAKAKSIIVYREAHKGFRTVDELLEVKGIGPALYERIRPLVAVIPVSPPS
jgi:competence protein ComEA